MNDPRGSRWNKWDLHVHTPASIIQEYGGDSDQAWERFLAELEALPSEFKVLGINDYLFLDGYKRVRQEKTAGRLPNIELILPVIELRLDKFGGTSGALSKVNFHVIFSDEIPAAIIEQQFLNALFTAYRLNPAYESFLQSEWNALPTRDSLADLGQMIIDSVPVDRKHQYGSPLIEGFNNITFQLDKITEILKSSHYFRGKSLTAVGKTEWWEIKWNDQSIADKKNIIGNAHFVFVSSETVDACRRAKRHLFEHGVNDRLLDCSDAHRFSDASYKDRIGKCYTWIKADPTFRGLAMAFYEPDTRVFLGDTPPKMRLVDANRTKYIRSIRIWKRPDSMLDEVWYDDVDLGLNHHMVAIIGNKGAGKSALSEVIGLLGNTRNDSHFSFLCRERFRTPVDDKSEHYEAALVWESGTEEILSLDVPTDHNTNETVKYIPQGFFDELCNEIASGEETSFDKELKKVIFSHVEPADRLGQATLDDLLAYRTNQTYGAIEILQSQIHELNEEIIRLEEQLQEDYRLRHFDALQLRAKELEAHEQSKPAEVPAPTDEPQEEMIAVSQAIEKARTKRQELAYKLEAAQKTREESALLISKAERVLERIENFKTQYELFKAEATPELEYLDIGIQDVVKLELTTRAIEVKRTQAEQTMAEAVRSLDHLRPDSPAAEMAEIGQEIENLKAKLDEPNRRYQAYRSALEEWEKRQEEIIGDECTPGSLEYHERLLEEITTVPERLEAARSRRVQLVESIYDRIGKLAETYRKLYAPVQQFINTHPIAEDVFGMEFGVSIVNVDFHNKLFDWIGRNVVGSFYGAVEGEKKLRDILDRYDFNSESGTIAFLEDVLDHLVNDKRDPDNPRPVTIADQLRKDRTVISLYDYMFSLDYLRPRYVLKLGAKQLAQLSPGERGILLLAFYLLVDRDDIPLVIDQPEENLDNQTLYEFLVKCIKEAKRRRQIVVVTHNPNLAVVCDAEQVICCSIDKVHGNRIEYETGAIENPIINRRIVDILEGTKPAFDNRKLKYEPPM
jgi:ABC-type lipoprotein export system ATPase subunit